MYRHTYTHTDTLHTCKYTQKNAKRQNKKKIVLLLNEKKTSILHSGTLAIEADIYFKAETCLAGPLSPHLRRSWKG